jgi:hypothetical protein
MGATWSRAGLVRYLVAVAVLVVGVGSAGGVGSAAGAPGPPSTGDDPERLGITVTPSSDLVDLQVVDVTVTGPSDREIFVQQCDAAVGSQPTLNDLLGWCQGFGVRTVEPGPRPAHLQHPVGTAFPTSTGRLVNCGDDPGDCVLMASAWGPEALESASARLDFAPLPLDVYALTGSIGDPLRPGGPLPVRIAGVRASEIGVAVCARAVQDVRDVFGGPCGPITLVPAGSGLIDLELVAIDDFVASDGTLVDCTAPYDVYREPPPCAVAAGTLDGAEFAADDIHYVTYAVLTASPDGGLVDGQEVWLQGFGIPPSTDGPPFWIFPSTGQWSVVQCSRAVLDDLTLLAIWTHCALPPGGVTTVDDPADGLTVPVQATLSRILGGTTDCTPSDNPCMFALARIDATGQLQVYATLPLRFA